MVRRGIGIGLLVLLASWAQAQTVDDGLTYTFRMPGGGSFMLGLSGAGIGGIGTWGGVLANPAGLGYIRQTQVLGGLNFLTARDEGTYVAGEASRLQTAREGATSLSDGAYVYKAPTVRGNLVVGIGYNQTNRFDRTLRFEGENALNSVTDYFLPLSGEYDIEVDVGPDGLAGTEDDEFTVTFYRPLSFIAFQTYAIDLDPERYWQGAYPFYPAVLRLPITQRGRVYEEGGTGEINLAGAVEAARGVMVGVSLNLLTGRYRLQQVLEEIDDRNLNDGTGETVDFDYLRFRQTLDTEISGVSLRGGVSAQITPFLRAGFVLETPMGYELKEDYSTVLETQFDNGDYFIYGGQPGDEGTGSFDYRLVTPWRFGLGGVVRTGSVYLALDGEYVDWSDMRFRSGDVAADFSDVNLAIRERLQGVWTVRAGGAFHRGPYVFRAGLARVPDPHREPAVDRTRQYVSAGLSYRVAPQFWLDVDWQQEQFDDQYLPYTEVASPPVVHESVRRNRFTVGVRVLIR